MGIAGNLPINGIHTDMRSICWSDRIWGSNLQGTIPPFPDTYEGSAERDCYMTFKLWELWKQNKLKGHDLIGILNFMDGNADGFASVANVLILLDREDPNDVRFLTVTPPEYNFSSENLWNLPLQP